MEKFVVVTAKKVSTHINTEREAPPDNVVTTTTATAHVDSATDVQDNQTVLPFILNGKDFFKISDRQNDGKIKAKCLICTKKTTISGLLSATTNFLTHIKVKVNFFCKYLNDFKFNNKKKFTQRNAVSYEFYK